MMLHKFVMQHHVVFRSALHQLDQQVVGGRAGFLRFALWQVSALRRRYVKQKSEYLRNIQLNASESRDLHRTGDIAESIFLVGQP